MASQPYWTQKPMPPGWEAKYDQRSGKYFFINHSTKTTQWVDPRAAYYMNQRSPAMGQYGRPAEQIAMQQIQKPKCRTCKVNEVPAAGNECRTCQVKQAQAAQREAALQRAREEREAAEKRRQQEERIKQEQQKRRAQSAQRQRQVQETHFGGDEDEEEEEAAPVLSESEKRAMVRSLVAQYTDVSDTVVDMVLESCQYKRTMAVGVLNSMSSKKSGGTPKASPAAARAASPEPSSTARSPSPHAASHAIQQEDGRPEVGGDRARNSDAPSITEKIKLLNDIQEIYTDTSRSVIEMVLESCHYNKAQTIDTLGSMSSKKVSSATNARDSDAPSITERIKLLNDIQEIYPDASRSVIDMVLQSCQYSKGQAVDILDSMSGRKAPSATNAGPQHLTQIRGSSPSPQGRSPSPSQQQYPHRLHLKPASGSSSAHMRASSPEGQRRSPSPGAQARSASPSSQMRATSPGGQMVASGGPAAQQRAASPQPAAASSTPKTLTSYQKMKVKDKVKKTFPQASDNVITLALESTNYDQKKAEGVLRMLKDDSKPPPKKSTTTAKTTPSTSTTSRPSTTSTASKKTEPAKKKHKPKEKKKTSTSPSTKVRATRVKTPDKPTVKPDYNSPNTMASTGSDASLAKGPNKDLLIDNYVHEGGADPSLRHGPNRANVSGASLVSMKSSSIATGPQSSLRNGPQSSLAKGSMYQGDRQS